MYDRFDGRGGSTALPDKNVLDRSERAAPKLRMAFLSLSINNANITPAPDPRWTPITAPLGVPQVDEFRNKLGGLVIGQPEGVDRFADVYLSLLSGVVPAGRPLCNLMLLGPTGTGKTRIMEAATEIVLGNPKALIKIDCAEFQHSHEIAKIVGSPPGYLGHRETHPLLTQERLNQYHTEKTKVSFVLFDEIEKASDALWNLMLGILDKSTLTLGDNRIVNFDRCVIGCTSNVGAAQMFKPSVGFLGNNLEVGEQDHKAVREVCLEAARRKFSPEFLNRFDGIIPFGPLDRPAMDRILDLEVKIVEKQLSVAGVTISLRLTNDARSVCVNNGFDKRYGARELKRALYRLMTRPLSAFKVVGAISNGDTVIADAKSSEELRFFKEGK